MPTSPTPADSPVTRPRSVVLSTEGLVLEVLTAGASVRRLEVARRSGSSTNVVLGHADPLTYVEDGGRWRIATGSLTTLTPRRADGSVREREQRVTVHKAVYSGPSGDVVALPAFPAGTVLVDQRSGAAYRVGSEGQVEQEIADLAVEGRQKLAELCYIEPVRRRYVLAGSGHGR